MLFATHAITAVSAASALGADYQHALIAGIFSVLPDLDTSKSFVGRRLPIISRLLLHRGFTHSLVCLAILYTLILHFLNAKIALYASFGWGSHIVLDMFNPTGVQLFWPCKKFISLGNIITGGFYELLIVAIVLIIFRVNI